MNLLIEVALAPHLYTAFRKEDRTIIDFPGELLRTIKSTIDDQWTFSILINKADMVQGPLAVLTNITFLTEQDTATPNVMARTVGNAIKAMTLKYPPGTRNSDDKILVLAHTPSGFRYPYHLSIT